MGQVFIPSGSGFSNIVPIDRLLAKNAGSGQLGDHVFFVNQDAGANSASSHLIGIGDFALGGLGTGLTNDGFSSGFIAIGGNAAAHVRSARNANELASVIIGYRAAETALEFGGNVVIGTKAARTATGVVASGSFESNVILGQEACEFLGTGGSILGASIIAGYRAARGASVNAGTIVNSIILGANAIAGQGGASGGTVNNSVLIGNAVAQGLAATAATAENVIIGAAAGNNLIHANNNVCIGSGAGASGSTDRNVFIGRSSGGGIPAGSDNTALGDLSGQTCGSRSVMIGSGAGNGATAQSDDVFILETFVGATRRALAFGDFALGNIVLGKSTPGVNRDTGGVGATNIVKLLNGSIGATNPVGGGYFYVTAGALHWVGSAGTDTALAPA